MDDKKPFQVLPSIGPGTSPSQPSESTQMVTQLAQRYMQEAAAKATHDEAQTSALHVLKFRNVQANRGLALTFGSWAAGSFLVALGLLWFFDRRGSS